MIPTPAYAAASADAPLAPFRIDRREPGPNDVLIDILYCGVCHSDVHQARDEWGSATFPLVPGHEIVGVVSRVGGEVRRFKVGDRVGVGCFVDSCRACEACSAGEEQLCEEGMTPTYGGVDRDDGTPTYGGYSTRITVNEDYVLRIPDGVPLDRVAPLLCAGITTYSPLRRYDARPGARVAILGLGGLGHVAVRIAKALGAEVSVLSHSEAKAHDARRLGADHFYSTTRAETFTDNARTFDLILDTVSATHDYGPYLELLRFDGRMVLVGLPKPSPLSAGPLIRGRRSLTGSIIGGIRETQEMLDFCAERGVLADVEIIRASAINEAYDRMLRGDVRYRFVIDATTIGT